MEDLKLADKFSAEVLDHHREELKAFIVSATLAAINPPPSQSFSVAGTKTGSSTPTSPKPSKVAEETLSRKEKTPKRKANAECNQAPSAKKKDTKDTTREKFPASPEEMRIESLRELVIITGVRTSRISMSFPKLKDQPGVVIAKLEHLLRNYNVDPALAGKSKNSDEVKEARRRVFIQKDLESLTDAGGMKLSMSLAKEDLESEPDDEEPGEGDCKAAGKLTYVAVERVPVTGSSGVAGAVKIQAIDDDNDSE